MAFLTGRRTCEQAPMRVASRVEHRVRSGRRQRRHMALSEAALGFAGRLDAVPEAWGLLTCAAAGSGYPVTFALVSRPGVREPRCGMS
jgi:hypothetical protein